jgi:hypothetical protein
VVSVRKFACLLIALCCCVSPARALDKQGSAHGGGVAGPTKGFGLSGSLMLGSSLYNPSYAARPDNSGIALMRYAGHLDVDLIGRRLSIPIDINMFSDYRGKGARKLQPSEIDLISGVTSTWGLTEWSAMEFGARVEHDRPADRKGLTQTYSDVRARFLYSLSSVLPRLERGLHGGDLSGWATLGWFDYNPSYYARPDNTGKALFRYAAHAQLSMLDRHFAIAADTTFFTDRYAKNPVRPSELDFTPEIIVHFDPFEFHLSYERDMPVDRGGLVQQLVYVLAIWSFTAIEPKPTIAAKQ